MLSSAPRAIAKQLRAHRAVKTTIITSPAITALLNNVKFRVGQQVKHARVQRQHTLSVEAKAATAAAAAWTVTRSAVVPPVAFDSFVFDDEEADDVDFALDAEAVKMDCGELDEFVCLFDSLSLVDSVPVKPTAAAAPPAAAVLVAPAPAHNNISIILTQDDDDDDDDSTFVAEEPRRNPINVDILAAYEGTNHCPVTGELLVPKSAEAEEVDDDESDDEGSEADSDDEDAFVLKKVARSAPRKVKGLQAKQVQGWVNARQGVTMGVNSFSQSSFAPPPYGADLARGRTATREMQQPSNPLKVSTLKRKSVVEEHESRAVDQPFYRGAPAVVSAFAPVAAFAAPHQPTPPAAHTQCFLPPVSSAWQRVAPVSAFKAALAQHANPRERFAKAAASLVHRNNSARPSY